MKIKDMEKLKNLYEHSRSNNKNLYACVLPDNTLGMIGGELTFVKSVSCKSFTISRPLDKTIVKINPNDIGNFKFIY